MPPQPIVDLDTVDLSKVLVAKDEIYQVLPHRYEFQQLGGIHLIDREAGVIVGYRDATADEFWVRGHIPGRPIFPGVLMVETAAQLISYYVMCGRDGDDFLGFGGVDGVKFRGSVQPGQRITLAGKLIEQRARRCVGLTQAFVDGQMVYEGLITGMWL